MATAARLTALASIAAGVGLAAAAPTGHGTGLSALIGWVGAATLAFGLILGLSGGLAVAALAFVLREAVIATVPNAQGLPLWATTLLIVLMVEFGSASLTFRRRPADLIHMTGRALATAIGAMGITQIMAVGVGATDASGVLVRAIGVTAVVVASGWVVLAWRRSGAAGS